MENKQKNELGNIYGSRISKNGKWLNLLIVSHINGEEVRITCPVRLTTAAVTGKPFASVFEDGKAKIEDLPVYADSKPKQEAIVNDDLPF